MNGGMSPAMNAMRAARGDPKTYRRSYTHAKPPYRLMTILILTLTHATLMLSFSLRFIHVKQQDLLTQSILFVATNNVRYMHVDCVVLLHRASRRIVPFWLDYRSYNPLERTFLC